MDEIAELMGAVTNCAVAGIQANDFAVALVIRKIMEQRNSAERQRDEAVRIMREFVEHYEGPREQCLKGVSLTHFQNARQFLATLDRTEKP
jgi:hypothetical protein